MTAQEGTVAIQRVGDLDADLLSGLRVIAERLVVLIADERVAQRLNQAVFGQLIRNTAAAQLIGGQTDLALDRSRGHTYRNLVVSDQSRDFLDQIARLVEIRTPCRRGDGEFAVAAARYGASDIGQDLGNGVHIGVETGHAGDLGSRELDGSAMLGVVHIVRGIAGGATTVFDQQIGAHLCRSGLQGVIDATLEAAGRLGGNLVTTGGTGDRHLVEVRGFQQHVLGFGGHLAIQAAHHAGDAENTGGTIAVRRIGDQQILGAQLMLLAVERDELLALVRATDHNRAFDLVQIVGVHRLAQIHHHIVRHVHGQRDGAHTATGQAAAHPVRGARRGVEATHDACVVAVAAGHAVNRIVVIDLHFDVGLDIGQCGCRGGDLLVQRDHRIGELGTGGMVIFARHATVRQRIAAVRGDVDLQQRLVEVQQMHGVIARLQSLVFLFGEAVVAQQNDAVMVVAQAEFTLGGAHAIGDVAVGLARFDLEIAWQRGTLLPSSSTSLYSSPTSTWHQLMILPFFCGSGVASTT